MVLPPWGESMRLGAASRDLGPISSFISANLVSHKERRWMLILVSGTACSRWSQWTGLLIRLAHA